MSAIDFFLTVVGLIMLAGLIYTAIVEWQKAGHDSKVFLIETLVAAAQQLYSRDPGETRFRWVAERAKARFPGIDEEELEALIEAAVYRLRVAVVNAVTSGPGHLWRKN